MKKTVSIFLLLVFVFSISACGSSSGKYTSSNASTPKTGSPSSDGSIQSTSMPEDGLKSDGLIHVYLSGKGEKISTPDSSFISYITYYSNSNHLLICMNGNEYVFANVSSSLWKKIKSADSVGSFYNDHLKGNSAYWVTDYDGSNGSLIVIDYID
ncbi:MAG: KTSC domain-containing protein [Oscillospiraceae bacterium]|nr:KTSC domain-containing protein [Oscillospiraceae bacterium]